MSDSSEDESKEKKVKLSRAEYMREYRQKKKSEKIKSTPKTSNERFAHFYLNKKLRECSEQTTSSHAVRRQV